MAETQRSTGTVTWFNAQKGFGFIAPDDAGEDLFVHQTSIRSTGFRTLYEGQHVEFFLDFAEDGRPKAVDVTGLDRSRRFDGRRGGRDGGGRGGYGGRGIGPGFGGYGERYGGSGGANGYGRGGRFGHRGGGSFGRGGGRYGGGTECYNCGRVGHLARDCYQGTAGGNRRRGGESGRGAGGGGEGCFSCGQQGHFARDCPNVEQ